MYLTYTDFFTRLDWELEQRSEGAENFGNKDRFRYLPSTMAKQFIHESIMHFANLNPSQYIKEQYLVLRDLSSPAAIEDDKLYVEYDSEKIRVHDRMFYIDSIMYGNKWVGLNGSSDFNSKYFSPDRRSIVNRDDDWALSDELLFSCAVFPKRLKDNRIWTSIDVSSTLFPIVSYNKVGIGAGHGLEIGDSFTISDTTDFNGIVTVIGVSDDYVYVDSSISASPTTQAATITLNTDSDYIIFPEQYIYMLILELQKRSYSRKGKSMPTHRYQQLLMETSRWQSEVGSIHQTTNFSSSGYGFGKI